MADDAAADLEMTCDIQESVQTLKDLAKTLMNRVFNYLTIDWTVLSC